MNGHVLTFPIDLCVYDLGRKILSPNGDNLENVWYTTILAFGREYAYSLAGIECCQPGSTIYGEPKRVEHMGDTEIPYSIFFDFVLSLSENAFRAMSYDVRNHNSTRFCDEVLQFTCGVRIPKYLLELPQEDLFSSSWEELVIPLLKRVTAHAANGNGSGGNETSNSPLDLILSSSSGRPSGNVLLNCVQPPKGHGGLHRKAREPSPDLIEIQAQIEAIRADQKTLKERRSKMRHSVSPRESMEKEQQKTISVSTNSNRSKKSASPIVMPPPPPPAKPALTDTLPKHTESRKSKSRSSSLSRRSRQKSPHPSKASANDEDAVSKVNCQCNCSASVTPPVQVSSALPPKAAQKELVSEMPLPDHAIQTTKKEGGQGEKRHRKSHRRRSRSRKSSSRKKTVSFDDTPPVEIVSTSYSASRETSNDYDDQDILGGLEDQHTQHHGENGFGHGGGHDNLISLNSLEIDDGLLKSEMLREKRHNQQEDDLFSTYESLKAHASPSPPPALLWTDLSKDEKKTLGKAKSPCSTAATKTFVVKAEKAGVQDPYTQGYNAATTAVKSLMPALEPVQNGGSRSSKRTPDRGGLRRSEDIGNSGKPSSAAANSAAAQPAIAADQKPITFRELDHMGDFEDFVQNVIDFLTHEEQNRLYEMEMWIMNGEGVWVLDDSFIAFFGHVLHDSETFSEEHRVLFLRLMAYGASHEDFGIILHMDRGPHHIMNYAKDFDRLPILEQEGLALLFANMFETCSEWLLYISEWTLGKATPTNLSNVKVTTKVAVSSLLGETSSLQDYGTAIVHNFSAKEVKSVVFDDVYTELTMAILQFLQGKPSEEKVFRCLKALERFCSLSKREVPQLVKMIGPEPSKFNGMSTRVEELVGKIDAHLSRV